MSGRVVFAIATVAWAGLLGCSEDSAESPSPTSNPAPALAGGTLFIPADGLRAIVSDPDRDRIVIADLVNNGVLTEVALQPGDEPGRATEDSSARIHVVLRRAGALLTIDSAGAVISRRAVCPAPRGIAYDAGSDLLQVACDTGELVSIAPTADQPARVLQLGRGLRDVIVDGARVLVSRLRTAELIVVSSSGAVEAALQPQRVMGPLAESSPTVAWRMAPLPDGRVAMLHQEAFMGDVETQVPSGYGMVGDPCGGSIVTTALTSFSLGTPIAASIPLRLPQAVTAVDLAVSREGAPRLAIVSAGNNWNGMPQMLVVPLPADGEQPTPDMPCQMTQPSTVFGEAVAVAFDKQDRWIVQSREPARLQREDGSTIFLGGESRVDRGLALFHMNSGFGIACASCHPEGLDDAHTWSFIPMGKRRTQVPSGGVLSTAPFHWSGDMTTLSQLVHEVFTNRMGGAPLASQEITKLGDWLDAQPGPLQLAATNVTAAERGRTLFESSTVGCSTCHAGDKLSDNASYDVGTGGLFQVPSLIGVSARTPLLHNGCANTLYDRFDPACGGGDRHGTTSGLLPEQIGDLVAYLETL